MTLLSTVCLEKYSMHHFGEFHPRFELPRFLGKVKN
jgi:hypothetical protein